MIEIISFPTKTMLAKLMYACKAPTCKEGTTNTNSFYGWGEDCAAVGRRTRVVKQPCWYLVDQPSSSTSLGSTKSSDMFFNAGRDLSAPFTAPSVKCPSLPPKT